MRKFKIDKTTSKKFITCLIIGTLTLNLLSGCDNNDANLLEGSILEDTSVIMFENGRRDIVKISSFCSGDYHHYNSVITGEIFADESCTAIYEDFWSTKPINKYNISGSESIIYYLTNEEIAKAAKKELTNDDIANILNRIFDNEKGYQKTK